MIIFIFNFSIHFLLIFRTFSISFSFIFFLVTIPFDYFIVCFFVFLLIINSVFCPRKYEIFCYKLSLLRLLKCLVAINYFNIFAKNI